MLTFGVVQEGQVIENALKQLNSIPGRVERVETDKTLQMERHKASNQAYKQKFSLFSLSYRK